MARDISAKTLPVSISSVLGRPQVTQRPSVRGSNGNTRSNVNLPKPLPSFPAPPPLGRGRPARLPPLACPSDIAASLARPILHTSYPAVPHTPQGSCLLRSAPRADGLRQVPRLPRARERDYQGAPWRRPRSRTSRNRTPPENARLRLANS